MYEFEYLVAVEVENNLGLKVVAAVSTIEDGKAVIENYAGGKVYWARNMEEVG